MILSSFKKNTARRILAADSNSFSRRSRENIKSNDNTQHPQYDLRRQHGHDYDRPRDARRDHEDRGRFRANRNRFMFMPIFYQRTKPLIAEQSYMKSLRPFRITSARQQNEWRCRQNGEKYSNDSCCERKMPATYKKEFVHHGHLLL